MKLSTKHAHEIRGGRQEGAAALEMAFVLMPIVFAMMFYLGMGYTIGVKQHAVHAARFTTATYVASRNADNFTTPSAETISQASFNGTENYTATESSWESGDPRDDIQNSDEGQQAAGSGVLDILLGAIGDIGAVGFRAEAPPERGMLPQLYELRPASSQYYLVKSTWTCKELGGSGYFQMVWGLLADVPGIGEIFNGCCETYDDR